MGIDRVGVVGAGLMGSGIAEVCARAGVDVIVCETDVKAAETGRERSDVSGMAATLPGILAAG